MELGSTEGKFNDQDSAHYHRGVSRYSASGKSELRAAWAARRPLGDDPGRIPYQTSHHFTATECPGPDFNQCTFNFPSVPTGKRLVAQHIAVSAVLVAHSTQVISTIFIGTQPPQQPVSFFFVPTLVDKEGNPKANGDQSVLFYVDGGLSFQAVLAGDGAFFSFQGVPPFVSIIVTGYLLDCKVNLCAAIAPAITP
jgi:hypothetical protein